jgi:NADPH:quinone reductase
VTLAATYRAVMMPPKGGPDALQVVELPIEAGADQLRVRVPGSRCGRYRPHRIIRNLSVRSQIPFVPGYEAAGVVDAVRLGVTSFAVGQRVSAPTVYGAFGELLVRGAEHFLPIPDEVPTAMLPP